MTTPVQTVRAMISRNWRILLVALVAAVLVVYMFYPRLTHLAPVAKLFGNVTVNIYEPANPMEVMSLQCPLAKLKLKDGKGWSKTVNIATYGPEDILSKIVQDTAEWEADKLSGLLRYMALNPDMGFIDIGSNIGVFTLAVANYGPPKRQIVAVDANINNLQRLYKSLMLSNARPQVTLVHNAVSNRREVILLEIVEGNRGGASIESGWSSLLAAGQYSGTVPKTKDGKTLLPVQGIFVDDLVSAVPFRKAVLKVDIEASEPQALQQADRFFATIDIPLVQLEWNSCAIMKRNCSEIMRFFQSRGYKLYDDYPPAGKVVPDAGSKAYHYGYPVEGIWMKQR